MALAAVRTRKTGDDVPALAAVPPAPTLAELLAEAQREAQDPARRVGELEAAMQAALDARDYAAAGRVKDELAGARTQHGIAAAKVSGLQGAIVEAERRLAEDSRIIAEAQRQAEGQKMIGDAVAAEKAADEQIDTCVSQVWEHLEAARALFRQAQEHEQAGGAAHRRMYEGKILAGEAEGMPRMLPVPNHASVLAESVPLVRELLRWTGPDRPVSRPVTAGTAGPSESARPFGGGGAVQASPWGQ